MPQEKFLQRRGSGDEFVRAKWGESGEDLWQGRTVDGECCMPAIRYEVMDSVNRVGFLAPVVVVEGGLPERPGE